MITFTISTGLLALVLLIIIGIYIRVADQANALNEMAEAAREWLAMQIRKERNSADFRPPSDPLVWLGEVIGRKAQRLGTVYPDFKAVEVVDADNGEWLVSALSPRVFKDKVREARKKAALSVQVIPPKPKYRRGFAVGIAPSWVHFDTEAEHVGKAIGVDWTGADRLWVWPL